jgi:hypothetical protein
MRTIYLQHTDLHFDCAEPNDSPNSCYTFSGENVLVKDYYNWTVSPPICKWLNTNGYRFLYNNSHCLSQSKELQNLSSSKMAIPISALYVGTQILGNTHQPYTSFVHVLIGGVVTSIGSVFVRDFKIVPPACYDNRDTSKRTPAVKNSSTYDEVFVISQYWGEGYFHYMIEDMPRIAPFLQFLRNHPNIVIHVARRTSVIDALFQALHVDPSRMVSGNVRGRIVYLPRSSACGQLLMSEGQLLSLEYRSV